jgi:hypothetical protein
MLSRIFPKQFDNHFRGNQLALWIFALITFMHTAISISSIFRPDGGAQSADGIPLDTFSPAAAQAVIGVGGLLDVAILLLCVFFILALIRYRSMIPLMYVVLVTQWVARKGVARIKPIPRMPGTATGFYVSLGIFALTVIGMILALSGKDYSQPQKSPVE